ncbi:MAG: glycosyltransferase family 4 protein, partial [Chthoniobacter sp.]
MTVLTRGDGSPALPNGKVKWLTGCGREELTFWQRRFSGLRWRFNQWDWPYFDRYRSAIIRSLRALAQTPETIVVFNDLISPIFLRQLLPRARICVWLQNEQCTRLPDLSASKAAVSHWLACSHYIRDWTLSRYGMDPARFSVAPSGVNQEEFHPRSEFDEAVKTVRVLFVGRIDPNKGPDVAIDAVAALRAEGLAVTMTVAGGKWFYRQGDEEADPYLLSLHEKIVASQATELGHVPRDRIAEVFREHDVVCILSRSNEPFGLVALEAMASGCAVIASNRGGLPEACGGAAALVNPDDKGAVISALRRLVVSPDELSAAKRKAVARAATASWDDTVVCLEKPRNSKPA